MEIFKPVFYDGFQCSADMCDYTCCREWDIDVDSVTYEQYKELNIADSKYIHYDAVRGICNIQRNEDGTCPFLDEQGLCSLVVKYGPDVLSDTCDQFPRFVAKNGAYYERALSNACPVVLQTLWELPTPLAFVIDVCEEDVKVTRPTFSETLSVFRKVVIDIIQNSALPLWKRMFLVYHFASKIELVDNKKQQMLIAQYENVLWQQNIAAQLEALDYDFGYKMDYTVQIWQRIHTGFPGYLGYERYIKELLDTSYLILSDEQIEDKWNLFLEDFNRYDDFAENVGVNNLYTHSAIIRGTKPFYHSCISMIMEYVFVRFTVFLMWMQYGSMPQKQDFIGLTCYHARILEHNGDKVGKFFAELELAGLLGMGELYLLLR